MRGHAQEEALSSLPEVVPSRPACGGQAEGVLGSRVPAGAAAEDASTVARAQPGLLRRVPPPGAQGAAPEQRAGGAEGAAEAPLNRLPWDVTQDAFGPQDADFLEEFGRVLLESCKTRSGAKLQKFQGIPATRGEGVQKTRAGRWQCRGRDGVGTASEKGNSSPCPVTAGLTQASKYAGAKTGVPPVWRACEQPRPEVTDNLIIWLLYTESR